MQTAVPCFPHSVPWHTLNILSTITMPATPCSATWELLIHATVFARAITCPSSSMPLLSSGSCHLSGSPGPGKNRASMLPATTSPNFKNLDGTAALPVEALLASALSKPADAFLVMSRPTLSCLLSYYSDTRLHFLSSLVLALCC